MIDLKNENIVIVGQQAWDIDIGSNCKNIALEFAKQNKVLYVNSPLDRITKWREKNNPKVQKRISTINGQMQGLIRISDNLCQLYPDVLIESINWLPSDGLFDLFNRINNKRFSSSIKTALKTLGFDSFILFNDGDMYRSLYLKELLIPSLSIYYSRDNLLATDYFGKHGKKFEGKIIQNSDLCVANSEYLVSYCKKFNPNSYYVGQGCDLDLFDGQDELDNVVELHNTNRPIIGYVGALTVSRLDIDLIIGIAESQPVWSIVLVGPEDKIFKSCSLHQLPNVYFLGSKPTSDLPLYINSFDVCFNPQLLNKFTIGNYPRKIDEYLAMGKPTIATRTETMLSFEPHVYLAEGLSGYLQGIRVLLDEDSTSKRSERKAFAQSHTWENSVKLIYGAVADFMNKR